jgi:hypothetical protein
MTLTGHSVKLPWSKHALKVFESDDAETFLWWEQRFFIRLTTSRCLDGAVDLEAFRKNEKRSNVIETLGSTWRLKIDRHFVVGDRSSSVPGDQWTRMSTFMSLLWLAHRLRNTFVYPASKVDFQACDRTVSEVMGMVRSVALRHDAETFAVQVSPSLSAELKFFCAEGDNVKGLLDIEPDVERAWAHLKKRKYRLSGTLPCVTFPEWWLFLYLWNAEKTFNLKPLWLKAHLSDCMFFAADCLDAECRGLIHQSTPKVWDPSPLVMTLRSASGRQHPIDPLVHAQMDSMQERLYGSSNSVSQTLLGPNSSADAHVMHCKNVLYLDGVSAELGPCDKFCFNWDPSTYSGLSYNIGLLYNWPKNLCVVMPPKA